MPDLCIFYTVQKAPQSPKRKILIYLIPVQFRTQLCNSQHRLAKSKQNKGTHEGIQLSNDTSHKTQRKHSAFSIQFTLSPDGAILKAKSTHTHTVPQRLITIENYQTISDMQAFFHLLSILLHLGLLFTLGFSAEGTG